METNYAVEMKNVTKTFGSTVANNNVSLTIKKGEILSLLGENGSGKTTIMNMLAGIYFPDSGQIYINGKEESIRSPKDAYDLGIGMIHQHFKLVDIFSATENVILCQECKGRLNKKAVAARIREICDKYGFDVDPDKKVYNMSVSEKQTLEIVKVIYRGADILILDEPTAVLTPQETEKLFTVIRNMRAAGKAIVIITHKLHEVLSVSDRVTILRKGEYVGTVDTKDADEMILTEMMVGKKVELNIDRKEPENVVRRLEVKNLSCYNKEGRLALDNISFTANGGEILGIAGISGCGEKELLESIAGLQKTARGSVIFSDPESGNDIELIGKNPKAIKNLGIALSFVPEDRLGMGLIGSMGMIENMMLRDYNKEGIIFLNKSKPKQIAETIKDELGVVTPSINTPVSRLSGGNLQKVLLAKWMFADPDILILDEPTRGIDVGAKYEIYCIINQLVAEGKSVIMISSELPEILGMCDRIYVMNEGKIVGELAGSEATQELIMSKILSAGKKGALA